jgi:hypothetical protein
MTGTIVSGPRAPLKPLAPKPPLDGGAKKLDSAPGGPPPPPGVPNEGARKVVGGARHLPSGDKENVAPLDLGNGQTAPSNLLNARAQLMVKGNKVEPRDLGKDGPVEKARREREEMEAQARDHYVWSLITTGAPPKWDAMMRDPKFRAAVEQENNRIFLEAMDELAKRRGSELGISQGHEVQEGRQREGRVERAATRRPDGLNELARDAEKEVQTNTTYGISAEHQQATKAWTRASKNKDRMVLIGKISGWDLKARIREVDPKAPILAKLEDNKVYGGDLSMVELDLRSYDSWSKHLTTLWPGDPNSGRISKTVQMKWGETSSPERMLDEVRLAAIQLSGIRGENPIPDGHRVIDIGVLNPAHPWNQVTVDTAPLLARDLERHLKAGKHPTEPESTLTLPHGHHVDRIKIRTQHHTLRFTVDAQHRVRFASMQENRHQHAPLLSVERVAKRSQTEWTQGKLTVTAGGVLLLNGKRKVDAQFVKGLDLTPPKSGVRVLEVQYTGSGKDLQIKPRD